VSHNVHGEAAGTEADQEAARRVGQLVNAGFWGKRKNKNFKATKILK